MVDVRRLDMLVLDQFMTGGAQTLVQLARAVRKSEPTATAARISPILRHLTEIGLLEETVGRGDARLRPHQIPVGSHVNAEWAAYGRSRDREAPFIPARSTQPEADLTTHLERLKKDLATSGGYALAPTAVTAALAPRDLLGVSAACALTRARLKAVQDHAGRAHAPIRYQPSYFHDASHQPPLVGAFNRIRPNSMALSRPPRFVKLDDWGEFDEVESDAFRIPLLELARLLREGPLPEDALILKIGPPWTEHILVNDAAKRARAIDHLIVQRGDPLEPYVTPALRQAGWQSGLAEVQRVSYGSMFDALRKWAPSGLRVGFAVQPHLATAARRLRILPLQPATTLVDPGVLLGRASAFAGRLGEGAAGLESFLALPLREVHRESVIAETVRRQMLRPLARYLPGIRGGDEPMRANRFTQPEVMRVGVGVDDAFSLPEGG